MTKKTFDFHGTIVSAGGAMQAAVTGQPVRVLLTIRGDPAAFVQVLGNQFDFGGQLLEAPMMSDIAQSDKTFRYKLDTLNVDVKLDMPGADVQLICTLVPWTQIDGVQLLINPTSWLKRRVLNNIKIGGQAFLIKSEEV